MVTSVIGGGYFGYKYVTSEQFQTKMMNKVLRNVQGMMPKVLDNALPSTTGQSIPFLKKWTVGIVKLNWSGVEIIV